MSSNGNGAPKWFIDPIALNFIEQREKVRNVRNGLTANARSLPSDIGWEDVEFDKRRSIRDECGWPTSAPDAWAYQALFDEDAIANRVVSCWPSAIWQSPPDIYETDDEEVTPFEEAVDELARTLRGEQSQFKGDEGNPLWAILKRAHILSRIGQYGVIHLGFDDGLDQSLPVPGVEEKGSVPGEHRPDQPSDERGKEALKGKPKELVANEADPFSGFVRRRYKLVWNAIEDPQRFAKIFGKLDGEEEPQSGDLEEKPEDVDGEDPVKGKLKLIFLRPYSEAQATVTRWETNRGSPRFDMPVMYQVTINDPRSMRSGMAPPSSTINVHWTRIIHIPCNPLAGSGILGVPALRPVLQEILDIRKVKGAAAEGYWKNGTGALSFETHPQLGGQVDVDDEELRDMVERAENSQQKYYRLTGMSAQAISRTIADPNPFIDSAINRICVSLDFPKRIFIGSERGELASSQDDSDHNDDINLKRNDEATPLILVPFFDRLIQVGVLPKPNWKPKPPVLPEIDEEGNPVPTDLPFGEEDTRDDPEATPFPPKKPNPFEKKPALNAFPPKKPVAPGKPAPFDAPEDEPEDGAMPTALDPLQEKDPTKMLPGAEAKGKDERPGYLIKWPDIDSKNAAEDASVLAQRVTAMTAYIAGQGNTLIPEKSFLVEEMGYTDEEAEAFIAEGEMLALKQEEEEFAKQKRALDEGLVADPNDPDLVPDAVGGGFPPKGGPPPFGGKPGGPPKPGGFPPKGGKPPFGGGGFGGPKKPPFARNAFCPGEGARDNSCSSSSGSSNFNFEQVRDFRKNLKVGETKSIGDKSVTRKSSTKFDVDGYEISGSVYLQDYLLGRKVPKSNMKRSER